LLFNDAVKTIDPTALIVEQQVLSVRGNVLTGNTEVLRTGGMMLVGEHKH